MYALLLWWWELFRHHQVGAFVQLHRPESFAKLPKTKDVKSLSSGGSPSGIPPDGFRSHSGVALRGVHLIEPGRFRFRSRCGFCPPSIVLSVSPLTHNYYSPSSSSSSSPPRSRFPWVEATWNCIRIASLSLPSSPPPPTSACFTSPPTLFSSRLHYHVHNNRVSSPSVIDLRRHCRMQACKSLLLAVPDR
ncbi:uncharacterized protein BO96DRAFT_334054 [Aspergillus niger CBS 101883]|uniref:uncharacterized protein n=1 Tax=Aspergillus lacticoffeatus (strain CBS 101883) TaxID=1450533 RepID=UPI000D804D3D|nr:uncharacterized protein BO96DRAFT_334054 [Aspergillus niger CBS 101883]PYH58160.1 hypothetical protein BO96DRAFT_334054 [Aspergillus niger CBS 101883]